MRTSGPSIFHPISHGRIRITSHAWSSELAVVFAGVALGIGGWFLAAWLSEPTSPTAGSPVTIALPAPDPWVPEMVREQLIDAGYAIPSHGDVDPLTRAAAADFFGSAQHPITPALAMRFAGTRFLGRADPARWNTRFGLHRLTRLAERSLTGPGGQLDDDGNLR